MNQMIAPIGHNTRDVLDVEIEDALRELREQFSARAGEIERAKVTTTDEAERATALAGILSDIEKAADGARVTLKDPFLKASRKIDGTFGSFLETVKAAKASIVAMIDGYRVEQRRIAEAAKRKAEQEARDAEAAAQAAAASGSALQAARLETQARDLSDRAANMAAAPAPIRSSYGQTASARKVWQHQVVDRSKLPAIVMNNQKVLDAIDAVIAGMVRAGTREIPGVKIWADEKTVVRR